MVVKSSFSRGSGSLTLNRSRRRNERTPDELRADPDGVLEEGRLPSQFELPSSDGEPMETFRHVAQMQLLMETLECGWDDRHDFFVGGNMFLYYSPKQLKSEKFRGPDVFVVLGVDRDSEHYSVPESSAMVHFTPVAQALVKIRRLRV